LKDYTIEPDAVLGRIFWTDCGKQKVSTVNNKLREMDDPIVGIRNDLFAITEKYETAVLDQGGKFVCAVGRTNTKDDAERIHRNIVENILKGKFYTTEDDITKASVFESGKQLDKLAKHKGWID